MFNILYTTLYNVIFDKHNDNNIILSSLRGINKKYHIDDIYFPKDNNYGCRMLVLYLSNDITIEDIKIIRNIFTSNLDSNIFFDIHITHDKETHNIIYVTFTSNDYNQLCNILNNVNINNI